MHIYTSRMEKLKFCLLRDLIRYTSRRTLLRLSTQCCIYACLFLCLFERLLLTVCTNRIVFVASSPSLPGYCIIASNIQDKYTRQMLLICIKYISSYAEISVCVIRIYVTVHSSILSQQHNKRNQPSSHDAVCAVSSHMGVDFELLLTQQLFIQIGAPKGPIFYMNQAYPNISI